MPTKSEMLFDDLLSVVRKHTPKAKVVPKRLSGYQKFIGAILKIVGVKNYMEDFWTTIFYTIYQPGSDIVDKKQWQSIPHEGIHTKQAKRYTPFFFSIGFLLGTLVCLVPAALFSWMFFLWVNWWSGVIFIAAFLLISFPPFGYFRAQSEFSAYGLSLAQRYWLGQSLDEETFKFYVGQFTGANYQWMWPFKKAVEKRLNNYLAQAKSGNIFDDKIYGEYYKDIYNVLKKHEMVVNPPKNIPA